MNNLWAIAIIILLSALGAVGDYFLKIAGNGERFINFKFFSVGCIIFILLAVGWFYALKYIKFSTIGVVYGVSTMILMVIIGVLFFNEKLDAREMIGIASGIISIVLLAKFA